MEIWVHRNGQYAGRFSESAIRDKIADGSLSTADLAWDEAKSAWQPISDFLRSSAAAASGVRASDSAPVTQKETTPAGEAKATEAARSGPPPLPSATVPITPIPPSGPPPLPMMTPASVGSGPGSSLPATTTGF